MALTYPQKMPYRQQARTRPAQLYEKNMPAPTKGWVTNKSLRDMKPDEAVVLDNMDPREIDVVLRPGNSVHSSGNGTTSVQSLVAHHAPGNAVLLSAASGKIFDATLTTAPVQLATGFASNIWQSEFISIAGSGHYTMLVNGSDAPQVYNGSTVTAASISGSGLTASNLIDVRKHKRRLFFIEKASFKFWYLDVDAIGGTLSQFDLGPLVTLGGELLTMATWTRDGGSGPDDLAVFITSRGEVIIYAGLNPGDANDWSLVGVFKIAAPLGRRCWFKYGGDVAVITQDGLVPLGRVLSTDQGGLAVKTLSANIAPTFTTYAKQYKSNNGWCGVLYTGGKKILVNVPIGQTNNYQLVMNTNTGAWTRYTGLPVQCFAILDDLLYFGGAAGKVWLADDGMSDNDVAIIGRVQLAFNYFGMAFNKLFKLIRPLLQTDGELQFGYVVLTDFQDAEPETDITLAGEGTAWDEGTWDDFSWSDPYTTLQEWRTAGAEGRCASLKMRISSASTQAGLLGVDWQFERGQGLG